MSALRRMRETDRPIAFKPWIYEIAKNACIDQFRRSRRAEEVSYDAEDGGLGSADYGKLVTKDPQPDVAVENKQSLDHLRGAFGGLSETHHEILVMRELEGLSYREIGERLGMTRPAVESTLFRARRRLTEEYEDLVTGERCQRVQAIIDTACAGGLGARDRRRLARHVSYCQPCMRHARVAGVDSADLAHTPLRQKIAALLPLPAFLKQKIAGTPDTSTFRAVVRAGRHRRSRRPVVVGQGRGHRGHDRHRRRRRRRGHQARRTRRTPRPTRAASSSASPAADRTRAPAASPRRPPPLRRPPSPASATPPAAAARSRAPPAAAPRRDRRSDGGSSSSSTSGSSKTSESSATTTPSTSLSVAGGSAPSTETASEGSGPISETLSRLTAGGGDSSGDSGGEAKEEQSTSTGSAEHPAAGRGRGRRHRAVRPGGRDRRRHRQVGRRDRHRRRRGDAGPAGRPVSADEGDFLATLTDTRLYSIGAFFADQPSRPRRGRHRPERGHRARRPARLRRGRGHLGRDRVPDARDRPGRPLLQGRRGRGRAIDCRLPSGRGAAW